MIINLTGGKLINKGNKMNKENKSAPNGPWDIPIKKFC